MKTHESFQINMPLYFIVMRINLLLNIYLWLIKLIEIYKLSFIYEFRNVDVQIIFNPLDCQIL